MTRLPPSPSSCRTPAQFIVAFCLLALACVSVAACDSAESQECSKDADCQEITCGDGTPMQTCDEGVCLQGDDCEQEADGGW